MPALQQVEYVKDPQLPLDAVGNETLIESRQTPEIIIGLCGPLGTPISSVSKTLKEFLETKYDYDVTVIKMSALIIKMIKNPETPDSEYKRINTLIEYGNFLRTRFKPKVLAEIAISEIAIDRQLDQSEVGGKMLKVRRKCYIIDSIKNNAELEVLQQIYGSMFFFVGVYCPVSMRIEYLRGKDMKETEIQELMDKDSGEEKKEGQKVEKTFHQADYFLRFDHDDTSENNSKIERMLQVVFKSGIITPSTAETAMYSAYSAAANSACLSRQVGACLTTKDGAIVSVGWNDAPKAGGKMYGRGGGPDHRCFNSDGNICHNDLEKDKIIRGISEKVKEAIESSKAIDSTKDRAASITTILSTIESCLRDSRISTLIEFSRAVHAEMHAILTAPSHNLIVGGDLYCTTYPCHSCARHIVMAGISRIFFIEPYKKSLAIRLHKDCITESEADTSKVQILMYEGVSPKRFLEFFKDFEFPRKSDTSGKYTTTSPKSALPKNTVFMESFPRLESFVLRNLKTRRILSEDVGYVEQDMEETREPA